MKKRCPTCGAPVESIFDHVDGSCPPEPEGGYPAENYIIKAQPVSELTDQERRDRVPPRIDVEFRPCPSPIGAALFDMLNGMNAAVARVYSGGGTEADANRAASIAAARHRPMVLKAIVRPSERNKS